MGKLKGLLWRVMVDDSCCLIEIVQDEMSGILDGVA